MAPVPEVDSINIRRVRWPSGKNPGSRAPYAHEPNQDLALFYARGDVDARRTAINLRRIQGICT